MEFVRVHVRNLYDYQSPGEIKRREVSWTHEEVRLSFADQARSRTGRWCWTLKSPEEIKSREVEWAQKVGLLLLQLFLNSSATDTNSKHWFTISFLQGAGKRCSECATDIVLVTLLRTAVNTATEWYTSCYAMARSPLS